MWQSLSIMLSRPDSSEYAEFYKNYIARVPEGNVLDFLAKQPGEYRQLLLGVSEEAAAAEPAPGKWSIKEVLGHVCDAERVMSYRALRFGRGDEKELQGFEQDDCVRKATIALFGSLPAGAEMRRGVANGHPVTVRALAYIAGGHAQHHYEMLKAAGPKG